jgi:hypothetical protein
MKTISWVKTIRKIGAKVKETIEEIWCQIPVK